LAQAGAWLWATSLMAARNNNTDVPCGNFHRVEVNIDCILNSTYTVPIRYLYGT